MEILFGWIWENFPAVIDNLEKDHVCLSVQIKEMVEQLVTIDDRQILMKAGHIPEQSDIMQKINDLLKRQLGLGE